MDMWCLNAAGAAGPGSEAEDTSVSPVTGNFTVTSIDVPTGTWGYVNFGDIGTRYSGEWYRFLVADLTGQTAALNNGAVSDTNSLMFLVEEESYFYLGHTTGGKVLVGRSGGDISPGTVRMRTN